MPSTPSKAISPANLWFQYGPDGLLFLDDNNCILAQSPASEAILGWPLQAIVGKPVHQVLCVQSRDCHHLEAECPLCNGHGGLHFQSTLWRTATGEYYPVDYRSATLPEGAGAARVLCFLDAKQLQHNQAELEKFAQYAEFNPAPMAEFDSHGQLLYGNSALQLKMVELGFTDLGQANIFPPDIAAICNAYANNGYVQLPVCIQVGRYWFAWHFELLQQASNSEETITVLGYAFDITAQKNAEESLRQQKMAASRDFYAKMLHELRTPLNAIMGFSDLLMRRGQGRFNEREIANLGAIKNAGFQLQELVTDTLDISKIEAGKMTTDLSAFNAVDVVHAIENQMRALAEAKGLQLIIQMPGSIAMHSDAQKLRQILVNLLSNAIKYTQTGQVVLRLSIENDKANPEQLLLEVEDTGMGIPQDLIANLFSSYQQIKEEANKGIQGTGLGLALVEELVHLLAGDIGVQSVYGQGSCFSVRLPLHLYHL